MPGKKPTFEVSVTLMFNGLLVNMIDERKHTSLKAARRWWTKGPMRCDCRRSRILMHAKVIDEPLGCSKGQPKVGLYSIVRHYVM